jgi:hypothetical protein
MSTASLSSVALPSHLVPGIDMKKLPPHDPQRRALRNWLRDTLSIRTVGHHKETAAFLLLGSIVPRSSECVLPPADRRSQLIVSLTARS